MVLPSRSQLIRDSALTKTDLLEIATCRGEPQRLVSLRSVGKLILDDTITDAALRQRVFQTVSRQELSAQMEQLSDWVTGSKSDVFHGVIKRFSYLRQFSPVLLRTL